MEIARSSRLPLSQSVSTPSSSFPAQQVSEVRGTASGAQHASARQPEAFRKDREQLESRPIHETSRSHSLDVYRTSPEDYGSLDSRARMAIRAYLEQQSAPLLDERSALSQIMGIDYFV
jgi:hypothetical protein